MHNGRPGSIVTLLAELPFGNYPLTNEVALAWASGISRSFVPVAPWTIGLVALTALSAWFGLRELEVARFPAALAAAALCATPLVALLANGPNTDPPALA